ncbi:MAG: phage holin family protein [Alcaligenaceae bacterium]|jgi:putative membrane protein|nr:phage holin family protein [Alcaligenaceae bacterium]
MGLIVVWFINALALILVSYLLPGVHVAGFGSALIAALVLGLINTIVRPVLVILTIPVTFLTLGLFLLVINGLLFWFVGSILKDFQVDGFAWAMLGAVVYSAITFIMTSLLMRL